MADQTGIEWTDATWNPVAGCSVVSPGCTNCYAMKMAARLAAMGQAKYQGLTQPSKAGPVWTGKIALDDAALAQPLRWKKPRRIFVNSMSDMFHESVPDDFIDKVFAVMALTPQHTYQVLTKRADRMRDYCNRRATDWMHFIPQAGWQICQAAEIRASRATEITLGWPLPNVWLGVSVENQKYADERIPLLLDTPAAVRWISAEPLLGPIDLYDGDPDPRLGGHRATRTYIGDWWEPGDNLKGPSRHGLDWVVVGGESGPDARPMHPDWARSIRDQCAAAEVPFFFKQWGAWAPEGWVHADTKFNAHYATFNSDHKRCASRADLTATNNYTMQRLGKKAAGHLLDGVEHREFPR